MQTLSQVGWCSPWTLALFLALGSSACAGQCPTTATGAASVAPMRSPRVDGQVSDAPAGDPLTLVGGSGVMFGRVDLAAMRRSDYAPLLEHAFDAYLRAEVRGAQASALRDGIARTDVIALAVDLEQGFTLVAQGRYTDADADAFGLPQRRTRRQHSIHTEHLQSVSVVGGRYLILAQGAGVDAVLDRLDGLEDPAPPNSTMLTAATASSSYQAYFSLIGIPGEPFRRELEREAGVTDVYADLRWAALSVAPSSAGIEVSGRVHTIHARSAQAILDKSLEVQQEVAVDVERELPALADAIRALSMGVSGTDATLSLQPSDARSRAVLQGVIDSLEREAQRRASYH